MRYKRQHINSIEYLNSQQKITNKTLQFIDQLSVKNIAIFLSFDGEISTKNIIKQLWENKKNIFLPVLHPFSKGHLLFLAYTPSTPMIKNKFGILEPQLNVQNILPIEELDIIFTPLVAFDKDNNRLGMGGGFYDRTLQYTKIYHFISVGLAYKWQQVNKLPIESWDQPLNYIITD